MKNLKIGLIILSTLCVSCTNEQIIKPDIQYISIPDHSLTQILDSLITYEVKNDSLFAQGQGYLLMTMKYPYSKGPILPDNTRFDTVFQCSIEITFGHPDEKINKLFDYYPPFYSLVNGRVINIYDSNETLDKFFGYSDRSKKDYLTVLAKYIAPQGPHPLEQFRIGESYTISYLENPFNGDKKKPVVVYRNQLK
jgi:hypothetical protein